MGRYVQLHVCACRQVSVCERGGERQAFKEGENIKGCWRNRSGEDMERMAAWIVRVAR